MVSASGGIDSAALFHLIWRLAKSKKKFAVALLHVNYGLRGEASEGDAAFCRELAQRFDVPFYLRTVSAEERAARKGEGVQAWARRLRRSEFAAYAEQGWIIALGHHQGDLAENVLLRMARGASPGRLLGMRSWAPPLWRPLLGATKAELAAYLNRQGLAHRDDASNHTLRYSRNVIRHQILPSLEALFPGAAARLVACAEEARALAAGVGQAPEALALSTLSTLRSTDPTTARLALGALLHTPGSPPRPLSRRFLDQAAKLQQRASSVPGGGRLVHAEGELRFDPAPSEAKAVRAAQHERSLEPPLPPALLSPGSYAFFRRSGGCYRAEVLQLMKPAELASCEVRLRRSAAGQSLRFPGVNRIFKLKELLALWQVPAAGRAAYQLLEVDGRLLGMWRDGPLVQPNSSGLQTECSQAGLNLRYLIDGVVFFRCQA